MFLRARLTEPKNLSYVLVTKERTSGKAAFLVALGIFTSRIAGLVRERVLAHYLGTSAAAGAYRAALRIPNLLQNLFGEGVLSASFIPVYARLHSEGKKEEAQKLAGTILALLILSMTVFVGLGVFFSRGLISLLAPGFEGETRELTIRLVQILFPSSGFLVLSAWCLGILNSHRKFFLSYAAPVVWNTTIIATLFVFGARTAGGALGEADLTEIVALGTVVGSLLQFLVQLPKAYRLNGKLIFAREFKSSEAHTVIRNFFPALLSRGVVQISAYLDQILSSFLGATTVAAMGCAQTLVLLPVSLFGMSVSSAELPELSSVVGDSETVKGQLKNRLFHGLARINFFVIPSLVVFLFLGDSVIGLIYQSGRFKASDTLFVWWILAGYSVGLLASTQGRLCTSVFWALRDTKTPAQFAFLRVLVNGGLGLFFTFPLRAWLNLSPEHCAALLGMGSGVAGYLEFFLIKRSLAVKIGNLKNPDSKLLPIWSIAIFSAGMTYFIKKIIPFGPIPKGICTLSLFGSLYLILTYRFQIEESRVFVQSILRRVHRR